MEKTTLKKNQTAKVGDKYSYRYVDIAQIHDYLESIGAKYIQKISRIENDDYIMTKRCFDNKWEDEWLQGCKVVDATLYGVKNPAQEQGSALTYARRYSLLMAFGLATEDDDAQSLSKPKEVKPMTMDEAKNYTLNFGKHKGKKLTEVPQSYLDWLFENDGTNEEIKQAIGLIYNDRGIVILTAEEKAEKLTLMTDLSDLFLKTGVDRDSMYKHYKVSSDTEMTNEQLKDAISKLKGKVG